MVSRILIGIVGFAALVAGCEKRSAKYCESHLDDLANCEQLDAPPPPKVMCEMDSQCSPPHCELKSHVCVECLAPTDCEDGELCDVGGTYTCRGCIGESDCASLACLPSGSCADEATVLYVDAAGNDAATCTRTAPCATLTRAVALASATRQYIRITGEITDSPIILSKSVEIFAAPGSKLVGVDGTDWVLKIQMSVVKIHGLAIFCAGGSDQTGVKTEMDSTTTLDSVDISGCGRNGAVEMKGGVTFVSRSNLHDNTAGALRSDMTASFSITNNFIHHNNGSGATIAFSPDAVRPDLTFEFNTVIDNQAGFSTATTISCTKAVPLVDNIVARNSALTGAVSGCDATGSLVTDDVASLAFVDDANADYHIGATSAAKDTAPDGSAVDEDFDGQFRPQGPAKDYGADEYREQ
jgi:hypothetical protein